MIISMNGVAQLTQAFAANGGDALMIAMCASGTTTQCDPLDSNIAYPWVTVVTSQNGVTGQMLSFGMTQMLKNIQPRSGSSTTYTIVAYARALNGATWAVTGSPDPTFQLNGFLIQTKSV